MSFVYKKPSVLLNSQRTHKRYHPYCKKSHIFVFLTRQRVHFSSDDVGGEEDCVHSLTNILKAAEKVLNGFDGAYLALHCSIYSSILLLTSSGNCNAINDN